MAIVNPAGLVPYDDLDPRLREAAEDVVLARRSDGAERLLALALELKEAAENAQAIYLRGRTRPGGRGHCVAYRRRGSNQGQAGVPGSFP